MSMHYWHTLPLSLDVLLGVNSYNTDCSHTDRENKQITKKYREIEIRSYIKKRLLHNSNAILVHYDIHVRKRNEISSKQATTTVEKSVSQLSISQPSSKKQKLLNNPTKEATTNGTSDKKIEKHRKGNNHRNDTCYIPDYLRV